MAERKELYLRALGHYGRGEFPAAIEAYREILAQSPEWVEGLHGLSMAQSKAGLHDDAITTARRAVELDPEDPFAHTNLSIFWQRKGDIPEAEKEGAKARMLAWKLELKTNPKAPPPEGGFKVVQ